VKNIVTGKDAEQARTERILQMTKDAKTITGADLLLAEGKRTNTAAEVVAERKISEIQGVRGAKAILADGREVDIGDVRATNEQTAQVLKYIQNDANRTSSDRVNNVLLKHAGEYADATAAISEAAKIRMAEMLGKSSIPETRLSAEMAEEIREASREDFREAEEKRLEEEYNKNLDATYAMLDKMQQERGLDDKTLGDAIALLRKIFEDALVGKFTEEEIDMALKAMNHDADVAQAERTGEVRGKNTRAEAQLRQRTGDGTTVLDGRNNATREQPRRDLGVLNNYGDDTRDIWERGRKK
jgi:hypothetical protein